MKKKIIALALAAVMVVLTLGLASCTGGDNTDPAGEGGTNAAKNGTLTVGFDAEFPPMGFKDDSAERMGSACACAGFSPCCACGCATR